MFCSLNCNLKRLFLAAIVDFFFFDETFESKTSYDYCTKLNYFTYTACRKEETCSTIAH